jgi:hypothetical protein
LAALAPQQSALDAPEKGIPMTYRSITVLAGHDEHVRMTM